MSISMSINKENGNEDSDEDEDEVMLSESPLCVTCDV